MTISRRVPLLVRISSYAREASSQGLFTLLRPRESTCTCQRILARLKSKVWGFVRQFVQDIVALRHPHWVGVSVHVSCYACGRIHWRRSEAWKFVGLPQGGSVPMCRPACKFNPNTILT